MKDYADRHCIRPSLPLFPEDLIYLQCPFLDQTTHKCLVYPVRPAVCRSYLCSRDDDGNAKAYRSLTGHDCPSRTFNTWELYGKTGLRLNGQEILTINAPRITLSLDGGATHHTFQVGRPVHILHRNGMVPHGICLGLTPHDMQVFDDGNIFRIPYTDLTFIL